MRGVPFRQRPGGRFCALAPPGVASGTLSPPRRAGRRHHRKIGSPSRCLSKRRTPIAIARPVRSRSRRAAREMVSVQSPPLRHAKGHSSSLRPLSLGSKWYTHSRAARACATAPRAREGVVVVAFRIAETEEVISRLSRLKARRRWLVPRRLQPEGGSARKHPSGNAETPQPDGSSRTVKCQIGEWLDPLDGIWGLIEEVVSGAGMGV